MRVSTTGRWGAVACGALLAFAAFAQETEPPQAPPDEPAPEAPPPAEEPPAPKAAWPIGDPPTHRWGGLTISVDAWQPELTHDLYDVALVNGPSGSTVMSMPADSSVRQHWRVWYHLPKDLGAIRFEYDSMSHDGDRRLLDAGNFAYGELLVIPLFAGMRDDGFADGFDASSLTKTRDFRLEYERIAFDTPRTTGSFHVGFRTIDHSRNFEATYFGLLPSFPPLIPPNFPPDFNPTPLLPIPDSAATASDYSAKGLTAGFDVEFKLHRLVSLWGSLSVGILRGKIDARYETEVSTYFLNEPGTGNVFVLTFDDVVEILSLASPTNDLYTGIFQSPTGGVVSVSGRPRSSYQLDLSMGVEFKIWRSLAAQIGLREMLYMDVGSDLRFSAPYLQPNEIFNVQQITEEKRSAGYEGYFLGVSYRF